MTAKTAKRAVPRKAAAKVNGSGHDSGLPLTEAAPERYEVSPDNPIKKVVGPYGDKQTYTFQPADGGEPIVFPHISEVRPDAHFFWKIYNLNEMFQAFEWMNKAEVPRDVQERVMLLGDAEKATFFAGWFSAITTPQGVSPPGES